ncbi:Gfo/Idh/MocA family oxidoreductase [Micromonospora sp. NPDC023956]|uniref:Gfo/Idh/MocA family protein n=1 Tax=Micromonospora sp. NPDC023956 TaxID=3155722 RepID=UPI0033E88462
MTASSPVATPGRVRVAVAGLGWAGRAIWLPRLAAHPRYTVTAVVDPDPAARDRARAAHRVPSAYADVDEIPADTVDLVVVAVPNHLHAGVAARLLRRGVPVFLEKPVCLTSAEADQLAEAERAGGAVLLAGSAARYRADVRALVAATADLGAVRHVDVAWVRARGVPDAGGWFTRRDLAGGGALVDLGWHLLDTVLPLLGPAAVVHAVGSVSDDFVNDDAAAAAWRGTATDAGRARGDVEDTARAFLLTADGASAGLHACWASHEARDRTTIAVHGTGGSVSLHCTFGFSPNREPTPVLTRTRDGATVRLPLPEEPIGAEYDRQLDVLPDLLAAPASRGAAAADARRTIDVIERIYRCARPTAPTYALAGTLDR